MKKASLCSGALIPYMPKVSFHSAATDDMIASFACGKMRPRSASLRLIVISAPLPNVYLGKYLAEKNGDLTISPQLGSRSGSVRTGRLRAAFGIVNVEFDQPL